MILSDDIGLILFFVICVGFALAGLFELILNFFENRRKK